MFTESNTLTVEETLRDGSPIDTDADQTDVCPPRQENANAGQDCFVPEPVKVKRDRSANVDDSVIISAWQSVALSGADDASITKAAEIAGMKQESFQQRISSIRKKLAESNVQLAEMPRAKGSGRKKSTVDLAALLMKVNETLAKPTDETPEA